jgi:uncharacterized protein YggU (UPF0235/DUF167 family)
MTIKIHVKPGSKKGPLVQPTADGYTVYLHQKPIAGAANSALIKILSDHFHCSPNRISIVSGVKNRAKLVEVTGIPVAPQPSLIK